MHKDGGLPSTRVPRNARSVHGDRSFDSNDADFLLLGVTTEEIRWLQSGVVVPRVTPPSPTRRRHLRQWARRERRSRARYCGAPVLSSARVVVWTFADIHRLRTLAPEGRDVSLAAGSATCVASELLDVDVPPLPSVCANLHRFCFIENRAAVHEASGGERGGGGRGV